MVVELEKCSVGSRGYKAWEEIGKGEQGELENVASVGWGE